MDVLQFAREAEAFADINPEMQLNTLLTFLFVAQRGSCNQKDLEVALGLSNATASRNVSYWTDSKRYGVDGVGFIDRVEDPQDRRYKLLTLSAKGRKFYQKIRDKDYGKATRSKVAG